MPLPTFEQAWSRYEEKGYKYGPDALEQVRLGYRMAGEELALAVQPEPNRCTKENPMPKDRDQTGQLWVHEDAVMHHPVGSKVKQYLCPHCRQRWSE